MIWGGIQEGNTLEWLLEPDEPGVRYLALRDLLELPDDDPQLADARDAAHRHGPIAAVLDAMQPEGFWEQAGPGYLPKYRSSVWALILLGQLGADVRMDARLERACVYMLEQALTANGQFSSSGTPSGTVDCLQGNLCAAMLDLGCQDDRLKSAFEWMARSVTGEGVAPMGEKDAPLRYYAGKIGPDFACGANNKLACAWGAAKVMLAFGKLPTGEHTGLVQAAIERGVDFLFGVDPSGAGYPNGWNDKPSRNWWKFGFPVYYVTDLLQIVEALVSLGYGGDPRLANALDLVREKADQDGRWALEYSYAGKTWGDFGATKKPNKWVTLRAARALKNATSSQTT